MHFRNFTDVFKLIKYIGELYAGQKLSDEELSSAIDDYYIEKNKMNRRLRRYEQVNKTKTLKELADVIRSFGDEIIRESKIYNTEKMANYCENCEVANHHEMLTREYGIRQQALMLTTYERI